MKPINNALTIVKQRCVLFPSMKTIYLENIKTWFDKKQISYHSNK